MATYDTDDEVPSGRTIRSYRDFVKDLRARSPRQIPRPEGLGSFRDYKPDSFFQQPLQENTMTDYKVENIFQEVEDNCDVDGEQANHVSASKVFTPEQQERINEKCTALEEAAEIQNQLKINIAHRAFLRNQEEMLHAIAAANDGDEQCAAEVEGLDVEEPIDVNEFTQRRLDHLKAEQAAWAVNAKAARKSWWLFGTKCAGAAALGIGAGLGYLYFFGSDPEEAIEAVADIAG